MSLIGSVIQSGGGGAVSAEQYASLLADIGTNSLNNGLTNLRAAIYEGWSVTNMIDGIADEYNDETGIDTVTSTAAYNAVGDYYEPRTALTLLVQSDTTDGSTVFTDTSGNGETVTANGTVQHDTAQTVLGSSSSILFNGSSGDTLSVDHNTRYDLDGDYWTIHFWVRAPAGNSSTLEILNKLTASDGLVGWRVRISTTNKIEFVTSAGAGMTGGTTLTADTWTHVAIVKNNGTDKIYLDGVEDATGTFTSVSTGTRDVLAGGRDSDRNFTGHMSEIIILNDAAIWTTGFTPPTALSAAGGSTNYLLQSTAFVANEVPTSGRVVVLHDPIEASTLNTDLILSISRDDGATWTAATLTLDTTYSSDINILTSNDLDISGQPSDTDIKYKINTSNDKKQQIHGVYLQWR